MDGLGDDPAILDEEGVGAVDHAGAGGLGGPLEERHPIGDQSVGVDVGSVRQFLLEQPCEFSGALASVEDPAADQDDAVGCDVAVDVLLEAVLGSEVEVVVEDLLGTSAP